MPKFDLTLEMEPISKAHGKVYTAEASYGKIKIVPLYHPAVAVYNSHTLDQLKKDFEVLKNI
jgi:DNA polymerase